MLLTANASIANTRQSRLESEHSRKNEFVRKEEKVMFGFRTVSKPRVFYNVFMSDMDVDCFFYDYTSEPEW